MNKTNNNTYRANKIKELWKKIDPNNTMLEYTKLVKLVEQFDEVFIELEKYNSNEESKVMQMRQNVSVYQKNLLKLYSLKEKIKYAIDDNDFSNLDAMIKETKNIFRSISNYEHLDEQRITYNNEFSKAKSNLKKIAFKLRNQLQRFKESKQDGLVWNDEILNEIKDSSRFSEEQNLVTSDFLLRLELIKNNYNLIEELSNSFLENYDNRAKKIFSKQNIYNLEILKKTTPLIDYNSDNFGEIYEIISKAHKYYGDDICTMFEFKALKRLFDLEVINSKYNKDKILEIEGERIVFPYGLLPENDFSDLIWEIEIECPKFSAINVNGEKCKTEPLLFTDYVRTKFPKYAEKYDRSMKKTKNKSNSKIKNKR